MTPVAPEWDFRVEGGRQLDGTVAVPGYKHSMVLAFAAAVAHGAEVRIPNSPATVERALLCEIVERLGGSAHANGADLVISGRTKHWQVDRDLCGQIHGALYLLPALLAQHGFVVFSGFGGDGLGEYEYGLARPIGQVLDVMAAFGADVQYRDGRVHAAGELTPGRVDILQWSESSDKPAGPRVSSATKTALLLAGATPGTSEIHNPHDKEAEQDLVGLLRRMGVEVEQRRRLWIVRGASRAATAAMGPTYELVTDPAEVCTWQCLAALTGSTITVEVPDVPRLRASLFDELAVVELIAETPQWTQGSVTFGPARRDFPGMDLVAESSEVSTDNLPFLTVQLLNASGTSRVADKVWHSRFAYLEALRGMGAQVSRGPAGVQLLPSDLRPAGHLLSLHDTRSVAACIIACLATPGEHYLSGLGHLERGYQDIVGRLQQLDAAIELRVDSRV